MLTLSAQRKDFDKGGRIELRLCGADAPAQLQDQPVFFEIDGSEAPDIELLDGFVGAFIHCAMERHQPLHINGRVTRKCLRHLRSYQEFWSRIHAHRYTPVRVTAEEIVKDKGDMRDLPAVATYSGGIDSSFSILRHARGLCGMDSHPLKAVVTVHGFDVLLADKDGFNRRIDRLRPTVEELGLDSYVVRTNLKELVIQDWMESHSAQLVACLHMLGHRFSKALIASDGYAQCPDFDFGGNAISIPLLTTGRMKVFYEGGEYGRTDKAVLLAKYPTILRSLKFCWEGPDAARNCGRCRGCILTYMNLRAAGVERPPCFDEPIDERLIGEFPVKHVAGLAIRYDLLEHLWQMPELTKLTDRFSANILRYDDEEENSRRSALAAQETMPVQAPVKSLQPKSEGGSAVETPVVSKGWGAWFRSR